MFCTQEKVVFKGQLHLLRLNLTRFHWIQTRTPPKWSQLKWKENLRKLFFAEIVWPLRNQCVIYQGTMVPFGCGKEDAGIIKYRFIKYVVVRTLELYLFFSSFIMKGKKSFYTTCLKHCRTKEPQYLRSITIVLHKFISTIIACQQGR